MAAENVGTAAGDTDVAERKLQDAGGAHHRIADGVLGLTHAPYDGGRLGLGHHLGYLVQLLRCHTAGFLHLVRCPLVHHFFFDRLHAVDAVVDVFCVFPANFENLMKQAKQEGDVAA